MPRGPAEVQPTRGTARPGRIVSVKPIHLRILLAAALVAGGSPAFAGLGQSVSGASTAVTTSVTTQQGVTASGAAYTHVQRQLDSGTTVHEYADASGTVFAVAWSGPFLPDLRELLGSSFGALTATAGKGRTSAVSVSRPDLMLVSAGHMGAFEGRAWLPPRLPAGFDPRQLP